MSAGYHRSPLAVWVGGGSAAPATFAYRSLFAFWMGGASAGITPVATQHAFKGPLAFWMGGAGVEHVPVVPPSAGGSDGGSGGGKITGKISKKKVPHTFGGKPSPFQSLSDSPDRVYEEPKPAAKPPRKKSAALLAQEQAVAQMKGELDVANAEIARLNLELAESRAAVQAAPIAERPALEDEVKRRRRRLLAAILLLH